MTAPHEHPPDDSEQRVDEAQRRHERLCAYIFGELDESERADVERELAASAELRAEKERMEATVALVKGVLPADEALSPEARARLTAAAVSGPANVITNTPWALLVARRPMPPMMGGLAAAAVLAVVFVFAWKAGTATDGLVEEEAQVAQADAPVPAAPAGQPVVGRLGAAELEKGAFARRAQDAREANEPARKPAEAAADDIDPDLAWVGGDRLKELADHELGGDEPAEEVLLLDEVATLSEPAPADDPVAVTRGLRGVPGEKRRDELAFEHLAGAGAELEERLRKNEEDQAVDLEALRALGYALEGEGDAAGAPLLVDGKTEEIKLGVFGQPVRADEEPAVTAGGGGAGARAGGRHSIVEPSGEIAPQFEGELVQLYSKPTGGSPSGTLPDGVTSQDYHYENYGLPELRVLRITGPDGQEQEVQARFRSYLSTGPSSPAPGKAGETFTGVDKNVGLDELSQLGLDARARKKDGGLAETPMQEGRKVVGGVEFDFEEEESEGASFGFFADRDGVQPHAPIDLDAYCDEFIRYCRIQPTETPADMFYRCWGDNPFELARLDNRSTFAADVDTASYALARNYLKRGLMPTKEQIRTEEFVNYFDSYVPAPAEKDFAIDLEMAPSLFGPAGHWMLRVVVAGREVDEASRQDLALTLVIDVSGSMKEENRIELVKHAARLLVGKLTQNDAVGIVVFSDEARLVLPTTSAANRPLIETAIDGLHPDGSTNAEAGLKLGYELAAQELTSHASNHVVLFSDGVANVGNVDEETILAQVAEQRAKGIYLNTIGVGMGNHNDALLEQLADRGDGIGNYLDSKDEAYRVLVENFTGAFQPIARDVKLQVEFDPLQVESYRQLGYENRAVADDQFRNDAVDAGEVGSGHRVTALYEVKPVAGLGTAENPLATVRVRYKDPFPVAQGQLGAAAREAAEEAREIEAPISFENAATSFAGASAGYRQAVLVAQFAEFLRRSVHARGDSYDALSAETMKLAKELESPVFTELAELVVKRRELILAHLPEQSDLAKAIDELCRYHYLQGQNDLLRRKTELAKAALDELQQANEALGAELEQRIRDLIQAELELQVRHR